jgi:hypothetical protein
LKLPFEAAAFRWAPSVGQDRKGANQVAAAIVLLLLIAILFGVGPAAKTAAFLLWIALALFVLWVIGRCIGGVSETSGRRWYYWQQPGFDCPEGPKFFPARRSSGPHLRPDHHLGHLDKRAGVMDNV